MGLGLRCKILAHVIDHQGLWTPKYWAWFLLKTRAKELWIEINKTWKNDEKSFSDGLTLTVTTNFCTSNTIPKSYLAAVDSLTMSNDKCGSKLG